MDLDLKKICRIGIDRIILSNIEFDCPNAISISIEGDDWIGEKVKIEEKDYTLERTEKLLSNGKITRWSILSFNPNKILEGHNIANSRSKELKRAIEIILDKLYKNQVMVDISKATISEIEININIQESFTNYIQVLSLLFLNLQRLRKISNRQKTLSYNQLFKDSTLDGGWKNLGVRAYDKIEELKKEVEEENKTLEIPLKELLRIEWWLLSGAYNYYAEKLGKKNTLKDLLEDDSIIDHIFRELCSNKLFKEAFNVLEKELIPRLDIEYRAFKESAKLARKTGRSVPRDVYRYLIENFWVFDYEDLITLVKRYDKKHKGREIKRIKDKHFHLNNKEKLSCLVEIIYPH